MGQGLDLKINRLPARTWNWLKMNEAGLNEIEAGESPTIITEGFAEAVAWREDFSAIATGMGEDMDRLARESNTDAIRIQSGPSEVERRAALHFVCGSGAKSFQTVELLVQEDETLNVVMDFTSAPEAAGLTAVQTRFRVRKNARLKLIQLQLLGSGYTFLSDIGGSCGEGSSVEVIQLFLGGAETYAGCQADLAGKESTMNADVGYLGRDSQRFDMNYVANHRGEKSRSRILAGGVLRDRAFKLQGNHGATIGRLDAELLFYLCSRGMSPEAAAKMITRARLDAVCRKIGDEAAEQMVQDYLEEVEKNGR